MSQVTHLAQVAKETACSVRDQLREQLKSVDPLILVSAVCISTYTCTRLWQLHLDEFGIRRRVKNSLFSFVKSIPFVRAEIDKQLAEVNEELANSLVYHGDNGKFFTSLPANGFGSEELVQLADIYDRMEGPKYLEGRVSGAVFSDESDSEEMKTYVEIFKKFAWSNPLWPKLFPGVRKMEAEVVRMCCDMMNGDAETCGTMSTGGSVSIMLAVLAHRNRLLRRGVTHPNMVIPSSAHAAFTKAAEVFRIKVYRVSVDKNTFKVNLKEMESYISSRTCMLVGSAPNFPFGTVDDIEAIAKLGLKYDVPVHVDACLGGFLLPFIDEKIAYDFRVPGVISMSADSHKYGLAPKGSSVVLYRNKEYLHNQYFCDADWQGGIYASATLEGSRSGLNIALCWAAMLYHGRDNYATYAQDIVRTTRAIRDGLATIPGIRLQGDSDICIVSWTTEDASLLPRFHNQMKERGWQLGNLQFPAGVHIMVTMNHTKPGICEKLVSDCRSSISYVKENPPAPSEKTCEAAIYGMAQGIPDRTIVAEFAHSYLDACYAYTKAK
ncbi:unnamed protein product [Caenorhabditis auriculariae]|uniref:sphinganine-1-phosphate aldolase n=1 Tax=Caenorhabditis auriculariae TaxID=2777116 RepID=A0A8S1H8U6_9PELO|nr:unnamed protein product [Caenorhabditis auriculariae]